MTEKEFVTWEDVENFITFVVRNTTTPVTGVYGLPRGGLVLAVMLSHRLHVPMLMSPVENCIIVDDICDSGESLLHYMKNSSGEKENYTVATMYYKPNRLGIKPGMWSRLKGDKWIVFPWEEK